MHRRRSSVLALAVGIGLALLGCRPPPASADPGAVTAPPPAASTAEDGLDDADSTAPEGPFELARALPSDTRLFVGFTDPFAAADALGRREVVERLPSEYAELLKPLRESSGLDLRWSEALADLGLAPHGPGGYAILSGVEVEEVLLFTVADRRTLRARLFDLADQEDNVERFGAVELHRGPAGSGVVVERGVAIFVRLWEDARGVAQRLAGTGERGRLDASSSFQAGLAGLSRDVDAVLFLDVPRSLDEGSDEARLFEGLEGLGATARIASDRVEAEVEVVLSADAPLRAVADTLRTPSPEGSALERFGTTPPVMALAVAFEPESALAATRSLFERRVEPDRDATELFEALHELVPHVTGELGVMCRPALVEVVPSKEAEYFHPTRCDQTYVVALRDPDGARRALERLASPAGGRVLTRAGRDFEGRGIFGTFRFAVRGRTLVVTEDVAGLARLGAGWPEAATWSWSRAGARAPIEYRLELDRLLRELDDDRFVPYSAAWVRPESPQEPAAARRKRRELDQALVERNRLERERAADVARLRLEAARGAGAATFSFSPSPAGLRGHVTVRPGGASFGQTWVAFADAIAIVRAAREREDDAMLTAQARIDLLVREIEAILSAAP